jgi:hypothetical protein
MKISSTSPSAPAHAMSLSSSAAAMTRSRNLVFLNLQFRVASWCQILSQEQEVPWGFGGRRGCGSGDSRLGSRLCRAITSPTIPTNASGILAQIALVIWTATLYTEILPCQVNRLWNIQAANGKVILAMAIRASISGASWTRLAARNQMRPIKRRMSKMTSINPRPPLG